MLRVSLMGLLLLAACADPYYPPDSGCGLTCRDANIRDAGTFADAYTYRLPLTRPLGECLPADEAECGCIDGFRRYDTCGWCPTGFYPDEYAGVCRGPDYWDPNPGGGTWVDGCDVVVTDGTERDAGGFRYTPGSSYCHTGKVCGASADADGTVFKPMGGLCYPVSFCMAATVADPPVPSLRCVYSDGTEVIDGPPATGDCPVGDPRQPYCGGGCGDNLVCPRAPRADLSGARTPNNPDKCVAFSETRTFGVCAHEGTCAHGNEPGTTVELQLCQADYGEPCACLVTHPQLDESRWLQGYVVLASVCRDYQLHFPGSSECVDAAWNPLPPP